jgi:single-strand DNA-binding protein
MELKNVKIKSIGEIKTFGDAGFKVVKFVVVDDSSSEYPQYLELQCTQDKADNLIKFNKVGDVVDCSINLRGREWINKEGETKVFNTIEAWKVFKSEGATVSITTEPFQPATYINEEDQDNLPF